METYRFRAFRPWGLRAWHWLNSFVVVGLLATVLLRETLFDGESLKRAFLEKAKASGSPISDQLAGDFASDQAVRLWEWHHWLGFALAGLLLARLAVRALAERDRTVSSFLAAWRLSRAPSASRARALHYNLVKLGYLAFYAATAFMAASGLLMYFEGSIGLPKALNDALFETHEALMWFFVAFAAGHVGGVVYQELRGEKGLVSDMIHGGERGNSERPI